MPGEYTVTLGFKKNGASDNTLEVPVNVTITAPTTAIVKHENYFTDNNAVAYGEADGTVAKYDLTQLFKTTGLSFAETEVKNAQGVAYTKWLNDNTKPSTISVPVYRYAQNADNTVSVYSSHEFTASIIPFNNAHIQKTEYKFNLTVKSAIKEGEFTTTASKTISTSEGVRFSVSDFNGVDVFGDKFYLGKSYKYNTTTKKYDVATEMDTRIQSVAVVAANDYATDYLNFETTFAGADQTTGVADGFKVTRKSGLTQLVQDTECQLKVVVVDNWGVKSEAIVTVILKKF